MRWPARRGLEQLAEREAAMPAGGAAGPALGEALAKALCYANRRGRDQRLGARRLLVVHGSPDVPGQYLAVMNAIFCAQKAGIVIDCCLLGSQDSPCVSRGPGPRRRPWPAARRRGLTNPG